MKVKVKECVNIKKRLLLKQMRKILYISPSLHVKGGISSAIKNYLRSDLVKHHHIYLVASHVDGRKWLKLLRAIIGLLETLYYLSFKSLDIIHVHCGNIISFKRKYFYIKLVKCFNRKIIFHHHGGSLIEQYEMTSEKWRYRISHTLENVNAVICLSENWKKSLLKLAPASNIKVITNGINLPEPFKKNSSIFIRLTFLGHIVEKKGIFDLLKVVKELINNGFYVKLMIGGIGDIRRLNVELNQLSISDNVKFIGWISDKDRDALLRQTDIFVLPSYAEAMPMSILEAMAYAVPVVSTFVGGIPELVLDGKTGFLVRPGDLDDMYRKITNLIEDGDLREKMGWKGRELIRTNHDIQQITQKLNAIYNAL